MPEWDRPTAYERWYGSSLGRAYAASLERVLRPWLAPVAGSLILDIGCGPGLLTERLFSEAAPVIGLDCSLKMVLRALARRPRAATGRQFVIGSVEKIPFADGVFDLVFSMNCLEFVADREAAFRNIARVLRPAGTAVLGVLNRRSLWEVSRRFWRLFSKSPYYRGKFLTCREVRACCANAGLRVEAMQTAVHFPPILPGPAEGVYDWLDRWSQRHALVPGGVILVRATKPGQTKPPATTFCPSR